jgi:hypothetical protein
MNSGDGLKETHLENSQELIQRQGGHVLDWWLGVSGWKKL